MNKILVGLPLLILIGCPSPTPKVPTDSGTSDAGSTVAPDAAPTPVAVPTEVHFSPNGGCEDAVVRFIGTANQSVRVQAFSFTSRPIITALVAASTKVDVQVILDKSDQTSKTTGYVTMTEQARIHTWIDSKHIIAHSNIVIVDGEAVELGSFAFTENAEKNNAENCLITHDAAIGQKYIDNWIAHQAHSVAAP